MAGIKKNIVIVAGFQGLNSFDDITTLGRGGSDTSAVAIAASMHADRCQIFTDVEGVYTADPRKVKGAIKLNEITYDGVTYAARDLVSNNAVVMDMCGKVALQTALLGYTRSSIGAGGSQFLSSYSVDAGDGLFLSYCCIEEGGYFYLATISILPAAETATDKYYTYNVCLCLYDISELASYDPAGFMAMHHPGHIGYEWVDSPVLTMETGIRNK